MMFFKSIITAAALAMASTTGSMAATLDFTFSFGDDPNVIAGTVFGIPDGGGAATSIVLNDPISSIFLAVDAQFNDFSIVGGEITAADFFGSSTEGGITLDFRSGLVGSSLATVGDVGGGIIETFVSQVPFVFTPAVPLAPIPLPAGAVLLLTGLGGFAIARRRKKIAA